MALTFKCNSAVFKSEQDSHIVQSPLAELLIKELDPKGFKSQQYHEQHLTCRALASATTCTSAWTAESSSSSEQSLIYQNSSLAKPKHCLCPEKVLVAAVY